MSCVRVVPAFVAVTSAVAALVSAGAPTEARETAKADMRLQDGKEIGRIKLLETTAGVLLRVRLKGLPAGVHGFHIHEHGKCEGDFESAGGILNSLNAKHGFLNDEGPMVGDLPNLVVSANGEVEVDFLNPFITLSKDAEDTLIDAGGASLVIFEKPDDYATEPVGNAGARIACGVIAAAK